MATIPLYFNFAPTVRVGWLRGPVLGARVPDANLSWNIYEWSWK